MFVNEVGVPLRVNVCSLKNKHSDDILKELAPSLVGKYVLGIKTPLYAKKFTGSDKPLDLFPEILDQKVLPDFEKQEYYLNAIPVINDSISVSVKVDCGGKYDVPDFMLPIPDGVRKTGEDLLEIVSRVFSFPFINAEFMFGDETVTSMNMKYIADRATKEQLIFKCQLKDTVAGRIKYRQHILDDIINQIKASSEDLELITGFWKQECCKIFDEDEMDMIFRDISSIYEMNIALLPVVETAKQNFSACCGAAFLRLCYFFRLSTTFISRFSQIMEILSEKVESPETGKVLEQMAIKCGGRNIKSCMMMILQHIEKYGLLLHDLVNVTPQFHPDIALLRAALRNMKDITKELEKSESSLENRLEIGKLHEIMHGSISLIHAGRKVIDKVAVQLLHPLCENAILYLFNDMIVVAKVDSEEQQTAMFHAMKNHIHYEKYLTGLNCIDFYYKGSFVTVKFRNVRVMEDYLTKCEELMSFNSRLFVWRDIKMTQMPPKMSGHGVCVVNNKLVAVHRNEMIVYSLETGTYEKREVPLGKIHGHTVVAVAKKMYVIGGRTRHGMRDKTAVWDSETGAWSTMEWNFPARYRHSACAWGSSIIVFGGMTAEKECLNDVVVLDTESGHIHHDHVAGPAPSARIEHSAVIHNDVMVVYGGRCSDRILNDVYVLELRTMKWIRAKVKGTPMIPRCRHSATTLGRFMFIIGGNSSHLWPVTLDLSTFVVSTETMGGNSPPSLMNSQLVKTDTGNVVCIGGSSVSSRSALSRVSLIVCPPGMIEPDPRGLSGKIHGIAESQIVHSRPLYDENVQFNFGGTISLQAATLTFLGICLLLAISSKSTLVTRGVLVFAFAGLIYVLLKQNRLIGIKAEFLAKVLKEQLEKRQYIPVEQFKHHNMVAGQVWKHFISQQRLSQKFVFRQRQFGNESIEVIELATCC